MEQCKKAQKPGELPKPLNWGFSFVCRKSPTKPLHSKAEMWIIAFIERHKALTTEDREMEKQTMVKLGEVMELAAKAFKRGEFTWYSDAVNFAFWSSFGYNEQSPLMQDVYCMLVDMGYTPVSDD